MYQNKNDRGELAVFDGRQAIVFLRALLWPGSTASLSWAKSMPCLPTIGNLNPAQGVLLMTIYRLVQRTTTVCAFVFLLLAGTAHAAEACEPVVGKLVTMEGQVEVQRGSTWSAVQLDAALCQGDLVRAGQHSRATVVLVNQAVLRIDQNTAIRLDNITGKKEERSALSLLRGAFQSFSRKPRGFEVSTPYLNGSIEGTEFVFRVRENESELTVFEGIVVASNDQGSVSVTGGESASAMKGQAPQSRTVVTPRDAAQWSLYYPPVLAAGGKDIAPGLQQAANDLSVGRVDEALPRVNQAIEQGIDSGLAYALRAVINLVQNQLEQALADANQAVNLSPDSAAAKIALSYAQQANFQLKAARDTLQQAVSQHPDNALALARLSELQLMEGDRAQAIATAEKAATLAPDLGRTQTTLGFAALAGFHNDAAKAAFERAVKLDPADSLPRLGLGLAKISAGNLADGRAEVELAVGLDSNSALLRAYLGKAYFEEKRTPLDAQQYSIAKELDPLDPTPYLYDGILKQTENDPVGALRDVEKSIELNGNRAVYRSRLLLDSDEAARNVSLARIHDDLGFQQLALVEGYNAVNTDPTNASAHRYLADSYSVLPRHEIARVSELLQSQLLNPLNLGPIQPRAAESNLLLISAGGPATASYNEFNSLFKRNQANAIVSGMGGEQQTGLGEAVVSGTSNNWSYSLGVSRFKTDGFRDNNDQSDTIGNAFIQTALSPATSLQFEYRHRRTENGDLNLLMDRSFSTALRGEKESDTYRGGLRHAFSPASTLLASVMYKTEDRSFHDERVFQTPVGPVIIPIEESRPDDKALGTELQYLYRSEKSNITAGVGYFDLDQSVTRTPSPTVGPTDVSAKHKNAYVYSNTRVVPDVTLTLGASWDSFDTEDASSDSRDQFNPKLGVTWQMRPGTTLRAAGFKVLTRSLISDQTLEPTQVAGFNQFYDDVASTEAKSYGLALDQKFSQRLFGGVQVARRDLTVPVTYTNATAFPPVTSVEHADWQEDSARAYLFMTPSDRLALSMEYQYQHLDQSFSAGTNPPPVGDVVAVNETKAHKVPLGIRFFLDSAWTFALKGTYVKEYYDSGSVCGLGAPVCSVTEQSSDFWLADATVSYRLPKRRGLVAFGATNLFDKQFAYQQVDTANTEFQPARMIFGRVTLFLP
jgi:Tfp pilus assembly protein PilF